MNQNHIRQHGILRGLESTRRSNSTEGRFGRMFRTLPKAEFQEEALAKLAKAMCSEDGPDTPETRKPRDDEENTGISAGYTYFGQFIDHDLTFDPASSLQKENDPDALEDFRTPRFDLDNIYGRGPDDQPYLYDDKGRKLLLSARKLTGSLFDNNARDLPRNQPDTPNSAKRAIIGDPRNDENVIVSQLQGLFLRFHNRMADLHPHASFKQIQRQVRWHYQYAVLNDFLPTIIGTETLEKIFPASHNNTPERRTKPVLAFYKCHKAPFIPVEFSVAAYRFGHSMVRPIYRLNTTLKERFKIFSLDPKVPNLTGFQEFPSDRAIDWRLFFDFGNKPDPFSTERIQPAYKIDTSLVNPLQHLPPSVASHITNLAHRNLLRGFRMGLPSGQSVARYMGLPVIDDEDLRVGKATEADHDKNPRLVDIDPCFENNAPLWYYILAEAQQQFKDNDTPIHLGPVGGRIVGEVFVGLMLGDSYSYLNQHPDWKPSKEFMREGNFGITELISQAIKA
jgi:hypothetical protein